MEILVQILAKKVSSTRMCISAGSSSWCANHVRTVPVTVSPAPATTSAPAPAVWPTSFIALFAPGMSLTPHKVFARTHDLGIVPYHDATSEIIGKIS